MIKKCLVYDEYTEECFIDNLKKKDNIYYARNIYTGKWEKINDINIEVTEISDKDTKEMTRINKELLKLESLLAKACEQISVYKTKNRINKKNKGGR